MYITSEGNTRLPWWTQRSRNSKAVQFKGSARPQDKWKERKRIRRSVSIAILTAALVIVFGGTGTRHQSFIVNAQQNPETAYVKISPSTFRTATLPSPTL